MAENKFISFREAASVNAAKTESSEGRLYLVPGEDAMVFEGHEFYGGYKKSEVDSKIAAAKSYADNKVQALGNVYRVKGSVTSAGLAALASAAVGDVYNVSDEFSLNGVRYPAGTNVVCVTAFSSAINPANSTNWDALGGLQDLSAYSVKDETAYHIEGDATSGGYTVNLKSKNGLALSSKEIPAATPTSNGVMSKEQVKTLNTVNTAVTELNNQITELNNSLAITEGNLQDLASKSATKTELATLTQTVGTKASQSDLDALTKTVGKKADQTALTALTETVGTKASQSDLTALIARVADLEELLKLA